MSKQYGLVIPSSNKGHKIGQLTTRPSIFNDDSDSDTPTLKPTGIPKTVKKWDKVTQEKAVTEDPTVYQYDEIFDEMDKKRKESKLAREDLDRKPKYIKKLLETAEKRKRENERRIGRQVQKEREEEGEKYKDKESFIGSAYKKKLEEMRELEEQEKREEYLEGIGDVRKQGNLDGFYRHLYEQKVNYKEKENNPIKQEDIKEEQKSDDEDCKSVKEEDLSEKHSEHDTIKVKSKEAVRKRKYRAHRESGGESTSEGEHKEKKQHLPSNLDADSDFSIDSSDSEDEKGKEENPADEPKEIIAVETSDNKTSGPPGINMVVEQDQDIHKDTEETSVEVEPKKPKIDIWKKRTVGEKFDEAVKRYFERKAQREMGL